MKTTLRFLLLATSVLTIAACGNKGALVLPDKPASKASPASPVSPASPASPASSGG